MDKIYTHGDFFRAMDKRFPDSPVPSSFTEEERKELENVPMDQSSSLVDFIKSQTPIKLESIDVCSFKISQ